MYTPSFTMAVALTALMTEQPQPPPPLQPAGNWSVELQPTVCVATRQFGTEGETTLRVAAAQLTGRYIVTLNLAQPVRVSYGDPVRLILEPSGREENGKAIGFSSIGDEQRTVGMFVDSTIFADRSTTVIQMVVRKIPVARLMVGSVVPMVSGLANCSRALFARFGIDPVEQERIATPSQPIDDPATWFDPARYPVAARRSSAEGKVGVRVSVREDGSVADCTTVLSSANASLDDGTCAIVLKYGRYRPARDVNGKAVASMQLIFTTWTMSYRNP